jgi:hypothetical protein
LQMARTFSSGLARYKTISCGFFQTFFISNSFSPDPD